MSAIFGVFEADEPASHEAGRIADGAGPMERMAARLNHRGGDCVGTVRRGSAKLGFCGSFVDVALHGRQPVAGAKNSLQVVCDGALWNDMDLRKSFEPAYAFDSGAPCEIFVALYEGMAQSGILALQGTFAVILSNGHRFFAARDPLGVKPLYFGSGVRRMLFASEPWALVGEVDAIREFPPGYYFQPEVGFMPCFDWPSDLPAIQSERSVVPALRQALIRALKRRLRGARGAGVLLDATPASWGLAAFLKREVGALHTLSVWPEGSANLESDRMAADEVGSIHHEITIPSQIWQETWEPVSRHTMGADESTLGLAVWYHHALREAAHLRALYPDECGLFFSAAGAGALFPESSQIPSDLEAAGAGDWIAGRIKSQHRREFLAMDRMAAVHGVEVRLPFASTDMLTTALRASPALHLRPRDAVKYEWVRRLFARELSKGMLAKVAAPLPLPPEGLAASASALLPGGRIIPCEETLAEMVCE